MNSKILGVMFVFVAFLAPISSAYAADLGDWGWNDYGTYDTWGDYGSYDTWSDYGSYDTWSDYGTYDTWDNYGTYDTWDNYGTYDTWSDYGTYGNEEYLGREYGDEYLGREYGDEYLGREYGDEYLGREYGDEYLGREYYFDDECDCYSYGSRGYSFPSYSTGGGYTVRPMSFGSPSYPVRTTGGGSSSSNHSSVSNVTNTSITNVDNSINDSFNNYNSGNVTYVGQATPQYPIVYTQPAPYCEIRQAQASGSGVTAAYLSWTSHNASSAYLSSVGNVSVNGSRTVWPTYTTTYTLTVYGTNGQSAQCSTTVNAYNTYNTPYVSLTQIPYTGFDFGTFGNAMYWVTLAAFALSAGYLAVYYIPAVAFAGSRRKQLAPIVPEKAPILVEREAALGRSPMGEAAQKVAPIVNSIKKAGTTDTMAIVASKDGSMPKIVIARD